MVQNLFCRFSSCGQEEQTMSQLHLSLLGTPVVKHGERTLTFSTRKALALLVYLAVEGGTHLRKTLSESFWPELDAEHGRAALRATLLELRKVLERTHGPGERAHLLVERETLGFDQGSPLILDLRFVEFASKQVGRGVEPFTGQTNKELLAQLEQATRQARGQFLASFTLRDSQFFDDWTRQQREYWHLRVHQLFDAVSIMYERAGDGERAIETVSRWLSFDPLNEEGYRRQMRLRFSQGDRVGALRAYANGRAVLADELQVEPEPETVALAKRIRHAAPVRPAQPRRLLPPHASPGQPPANLLDGPLLGSVTGGHRRRGPMCWWGALCKPEGNSRTSHSSMSCASAWSKNMPPMISSAMSGWPNSPACCPNCATAIPIYPFLRRMRRSGTIACSKSPLVSSRYGPHGIPWCSCSMICNGRIQRRSIWCSTSRGASPNSPRRSFCCSTCARGLRTSPTCSPPGCWPSSGRALR